ncbi:MAG: hypothetical protein R3228_01045, partial [Halioglobus sp.]|nr:hypothetical protein [Halioglobus sp.]
MSLILDALNRSRRESEQVPGIDAPLPASAPARSSYLPWVALAAALLLIAWLLVERQTPAEKPAPADDGAVAALSNNVASALTSVKAELQSRAAEEDPGPRVAAQPALAPTPPAATAPADKPAPGDDGAVAALSNNVASALTSVKAELQSRAAEDDPGRQFAAQAAPAPAPPAATAPAGSGAQAPSPAAPPPGPVQQSAAA